MRLITIVLIFLNFKALSQENSIEGTIIDSETLQPIEKVEIQIKNSNLKTETNNQGKFSFNSLEDGVYELLIFKPTFKQIKKTITLSENTMEFDLRKRKTI